MIHAYQEIYLSNAQATMGEALDYAVNTCGLSGADFVKMFTVSSVSKHMENGEPNWLSGKSGIEIAEEVFKETTGRSFARSPQTRLGRSKEYWIGWAAAYYQWYSSRKFGEIFKAIPYADFEALYYTLHEADISKFVDVAEKQMKAVFPETNLKRIRTAYGCSQAELANRSGVSLRSIQMYEQRNKDINKASVETVQRLAKFLGCTIEDLMEKA